MNITEQYLNEHPEAIFVYGDNHMRCGMGGAAALRLHPQSIGFITKKEPNDATDSFYKPENYLDTYLYEVQELRRFIQSHPEKTFMISRLGAGLANRFGIFEKIIDPTIRILLQDLSNVVFLW